MVVVTAAIFGYLGEAFGSFQDGSASRSINLINFRNSCSCAAASSLVVVLDARQFTTIHRAFRTSYRLVSPFCKWTKIQRTGRSVHLCCKEQSAPATGGCDKRAGNFIAAKWCFITCS
jgi:hypothetical protein